jgi:hypothetical protein
MHPVGIRTVDLLARAEWLCGISFAPGQSIDHFYAIVYQVPFQVLCLSASVHKGRFEAYGCVTGHLNSQVSSEINSEHTVITEGRNIK